MITPPASFWKIIRRGITLRCPKCGEGKLFKSYLKQVDNCASCNESFKDIRADDGPPWLTIVIVGHILAPVMLVLIPKLNWPDWISILVWSAIALIMTFAIMPSSKGFFIGLIWRQNFLRKQM